MPSTAKTKIGQRIEATANLLTTTSVLGYISNVARNELTDAVREGNQTKALAAVDIIDKTLSSVKKRVRADTYQASQVSASKISYASKRLAVEEKRKEALNPIRKSVRKSDAFAACEKFVKSSLALPQKKASSISQPNPIRRLSRRALPRASRRNLPQGILPGATAAPQIPLPTTGFHYSPQEVVDIIEGIDSARDQVRAKDYMISEGRVPLSERRSINKMLNKATKTGQVPRYWNSKGHPPVLNEMEMKQLGNKLSAKKNFSWKLPAFQKEVAKAVEERYSVAGMSIVGRNVKPTKKTLNNMMTAMVLNGHAVPVTSVIAKTQTRHTAETSLMAAVALAVTVAGTHFYEVAPSTNVAGDTDVDPVRASIAEANAVEATDGAKLLVDLVRSAHNGRPIKLVKPWYVFSTDDTTSYIFPGRIEPGSDVEFFLASSCGVDERDTHSSYSVEENVSMNGFRIKLTFTFSAGGHMAPIYITVTGLSEKELPVSLCPTGMLKIKIPGLAIGSATDPRNQELGYIVFLRKTGDNSLDVRRFRDYRNTVFIPFVGSLRKAYNGVEVDSGSKAPEGVTAVSYCDGDIPQVAAITDPVQMAKDALLRIISNKQNAARSAVEQAADLMKIFRFLKRMIKITTSSNIPDTPLKKGLIVAFTELKKERKLILPKSHLDALIDFCCVIVTILAKVATPENIRDGFIRGGMIDAASLMIPDLFAMLNTTRRALSLEELENCKASFPSLLKYFLEHGHVPDDVFECHGLPIDADIKGNKVRRTATINNEVCQRAKCFSHPTQKALRDKRNIDVQEKADAAKQLKEIERSQWRVWNQKCEEEITRKLPQGKTLADAPIKLFEKPLARLLSSFI